MIALCAISALSGVLAHAQWRSIGPFGGAIAVVRVDARHGGVVVAGAANALLFQSRDGGGSWQPLPFPPQLRSVLHAFQIDSEGNYYVGLGSDTPELNGLYCSRDEGHTWTAVPGLRGKEVWSLALWGGGDQVMAAGVRDGVFLTRDRGATWSRISPVSNRDLQPVVSLAFDTQSSNILYAGTPHLPWKTVNGGVSWYSIHSGMLDDSDVFSIAVDRTNPQHVYATACSGIYTSGNGAGLWRKLTGARDASYRTYTVAQDPDVPAIVFAGTTGGLIRSSDSGASWRRVIPDATRAVAFDLSKPGRVYVGTDQRAVLRSDDGGQTFRDASTGLCNRHLSTLAVTSDGLYTTSIYEPSAGGVFQLAPAGWTRIAPASELGGEQILTIASAPDRKLYAATYSALLTSVDGGKTWTRLPGPARASRITGLAAINGRLILGSTGGLFNSDNGGKTWVENLVPSGLKNLSGIVTLDSSTVAAISHNGAMVSRDGLAWMVLGALPDMARFYGLVGMGTPETGGGGQLLAATSGGLYRSTDHGISWRHVKWALENSTVTAICRDSQSPNRVFAAHFDRVFESDDSGVTWESLPSGDVPLNSVRALAVLPGADERLFVLTQHQGIFTIPLAATPSDVSVSTSGYTSNPRENRKDRK